MPCCAVATCKNSNKRTKGSGVRYYSFPKNEDLTKQWVQACHRKDHINVKNARVCSIHFSADSFEIPMIQRLLGYRTNNFRYLKDDAMPTLHMPFSVNSFKTSNTESTGIKKREQQNILSSLLEVSTSKELQHTPDVDEPMATEQIDTKVDWLMNNNTHEYRLQEVEELKERVKVLEEKNEQLLKQFDLIKSQANNYKRILATVFTPGQVKKLLAPYKEKKIRWTPEDISAAISLRSVSSKAYKYLKANYYPLPALSTLRKWTTTFDISKGILKNVISLMKTKSSDMTELDRICVLSFDDIHLSNKTGINKKHECAVGPHKTCQTAMVRGLFSNWQQPVYYEFDQPMTKQILVNIIEELFNAHFVVVAISSNMDTSDVAMWSKLNVGHDQNCSFDHPSDSSLKIFVYANVLHLIKLARNHLFDDGFIAEENVINIGYFKALFDVPKSGLALAHKMTEHHLNVKGSMRQRVRLAVQVFSNTTAQAIRYAGKYGLFPDNSGWEKAAGCMQLFNDWFDLLNSRCESVGNCPSKKAFGIEYENQIKLVDEMTDLISSMRVGNHKDIIPFQKGIILTNRSLLDMYDYLKEKYNVEYVLTSRLNHDVLENFFAYIRGTCVSNNYLYPRDFAQRLRWYILGKNSNAIIIENKKTTESEESCLLNISDQNKPTTSNGGADCTAFCLTEKMLSNLTTGSEITLNMQTEASS